MNDSSPTARAAGRPASRARRHRPARRSAEDGGDDDVLAGGAREAGQRLDQVVARKQRRQPRHREHQGGGQRQQARDATSIVRTTASQPGTRCRCSQASSGWIVMTIISARKAGPTMPEALRRPATATTTPAMPNSTSNPCGSANARSAARDRRTPGAGASTADTGRSGSGDGDDVDGMAALLPWWRSRGGYPWPPRETTPRRSAAAPEPFDGGRAELPQVGQDQVRRL